MLPTELPRPQQTKFRRDLKQNQKSAKKVSSFFPFNVFFSISVASVIILKKDILFEAVRFALARLKRNIKKFKAIFGSLEAKQGRGRNSRKTILPKMLNKTLGLI